MREQHFVEQGNSGPRSCSLGHCESVLAARYKSKRASQSQPVAILLCPLLTGARPALRILQPNSHANIRFGEM
jgi:hypothetical protein